MFSFFMRNRVVGLLESWCLRGEECALVSVNGRLAFKQCRS